MTPFRSPAISSMTGEHRSVKLSLIESLKSQFVMQACVWNAGSPEAQGKAELLMAVISSINKWQGYTVGASRVVSHVAGSLSKHRRIIHEVRLTPKDLVLAHLSRSHVECRSCTEPLADFGAMCCAPGSQRMQHDGPELCLAQRQHCGACGGVWATHYGDAHFPTATPT